MAPTKQPHTSVRAMGTASSSKQAHLEILMVCDHRVTDHPELWQLYNFHFLSRSRSAFKGQGSAHPDPDRKHILLMQVPRATPWIGRVRQKVQHFRFERRLSDHGLEFRNVKDVYNCEWLDFNAVVPKKRTMVPKEKIYGSWKGPEGERNASFVGYLDKEEQERYRSGEL